MTGDGRHIATRAIHAGRGPRVPGTPLNPPVVLASSFHGDGYAREQGSPAWEPLEAAIGELEGGTSVAFASGVAAAAAVVDVLPAGARVVAPAAGYAWTRSLLESRATSGHISLEALDTTRTDEVLAAARDAQLVWLESPSNPLLHVTELDVICAATRDTDTLVVVDSTFATPLVQRPLELGADIAMQSATKFIGGHSDLLLGVLTARDAALAGRLRHARAQFGATPGALEAFLALRGLRTLPVRLGLAQETALLLATRLAGHPAVSAVHYPGLPHDPGHERARRFMDGFGAMLSFELAAGAEHADAVCARVEVMTHAKSLGGVETLIERRARAAGSGAPAGLLRISVGCEHPEDLWADLAQALAQGA
jgi:cystathionine gamma-synthase